MQMVFVLTIIGLLTWGLIAFGEMVTKAIQSRRATTETEPLNYEGVIDAVGNGLMGVDDPANASGQAVGGLFGRLLEHVGHWLHH